MIYIHVPFCRSFCTYCDFYSEIACKGRDAAAIEAWADGVCEEIAARRSEIEATLDLDTLYIGGGTPSVLPLSVLQRILDALPSRRYREFTVEVNPEDIVERGAEYVQGLLDLGVTRPLRLASLANASRFESAKPNWNFSMISSRMPRLRKYCLPMAWPSTSFFKIS